VKRPYLGADIKINSVNELVSIDVCKGLPANEAGIKLGDVAMQIGGDSAFSGCA
jgi:C-terminal processing protease CtpA/Prc